MPDPVFAKGMFVNRNDKAPAFVICNLSIKADEFYKFLQDSVNEKGYVNINVLRSKTGGKLYAQLDTWKPNQEQQPKQDTGDMGYGQNEEPAF